jgi:tetratricopeptide (TPR) repeat protein
MKSQTIFLAFLVVVIIVGLMMPLGIRAAVANNAWSVRFLQSVTQNETIDPNWFDPPETHPHAGLLLAHQALKLGDLYSADRFLTPLRISSQPLVLNTVGTLLYRQEQYEAAFDVWRRTGNDKFLEYAAHDLMGKGEEELVLLAYLSAWEVNPLEFEDNALPIKITLANALREAGRLAEAITAYQEIIEQFPERGEVFFEIAWAYWLNGQPEQARKALDEASIYETTNSSHYLHAGMIYEGSSLPDKARQAYQNALAINPSLAEAQQGLRRLDTLDD